MVDRDRLARPTTQALATTVRRRRRSTPTQILVGAAIKLALVACTALIFGAAAWHAARPHELSTAALHKRHDPALPVQSPSWIPYLTWYEALALPGERIAFVVGLLGWLFCLFAFVGLVASDYFCVNLSTLSARLGMSEGVAGSTLLAFGNGSPDVFSTFAALKAGSGALAIGELLGAAAFIVSVVAGSMCIVRPFKVAPHTFLRDVGFFTVAVVFTIGILYDGRITQWEAGAMIVLYAFYVLSVILLAWWLRRRARQDALMRAVRSEYADEAPYRDEPESGQTPLSGTLSPARTPNRTRSGSSSVRSLIMIEDLPADVFHAHIDATNDAEAAEERAAENAAMLELAGQGKALVIASRRRAVSTSSVVSPGPSPVTVQPRRPTARSAVRASLLGAIEFRDVVNSLQADASAHRTLAVFSGLSEATSRHRRTVSTGDAAHRSAPFAITPKGELHHSVTSTASAPPRPSTSDADGYFAGVRPVSSAAEGRLIRIDDDEEEEPNPWSSVDRSQDRPLSLAIPTGNLLGQDILDSPSVQTPLGLRKVPSIMLTDEGGDSIPVQQPPTPAEPHPSWTKNKRRRTRALLRAVGGALFPSLQDWGSKSNVGRLVAVLSAPAILALNLTLPVVDESADEEDDYERIEKIDEAYRDDPERAHRPGDDARHERTIAHELHRPVTVEPHAADDDAAALDDYSPSAAALQRGMTILQCFLGPIFCAAAYVGDAFDTWWIPVTAVAIGVAFAAIAFAATRRGLNGPTRIWLCFIGFAVAVTWVSSIVNEIVGCLQTVGVVFHLSDAIIGLTVFAMGNSLGDLVANLTIARMGFPSMALSATYGGPLLNILLGVGASGSFFVFRSGKSYKIPFSPTLVTTSAALLAILVTTLVCVPASGYYMSRKFGGALIAAYCALLVVNILVELRFG